MACFYVPVDATSQADVTSAWGCLDPLRRCGEKTGLMLVPLKGWSGFTGALRMHQIASVGALCRQYGSLPLVVMAPNLPWMETDWYHQTERALERLKLAIDFSCSLPGQRDELVVTFHLNTLFRLREWDELGQTIDERFDRCQRMFRDIILPALTKAANYASASRVRVCVETTPVPEFGDRPESELNTLINPYPLHSGRGIDEVRAAGLGIALDLCHTFTLLQAVETHALTGDRLFDDARGMFPADQAYLAGRSIVDEVRALQRNDVVHLNDSRGSFDLAQHTLHEEGVALGDGDISDWASIIPALRRQQLNVIFEIHESDYTTHSNLQRSVDFFVSKAY